MKLAMPSQQARNIDALMWDHRLRRWPNIKPTLIVWIYVFCCLTLGKNETLILFWLNVRPASRVCVFGQ